jgi:phosphatidylglycerophosphatase A
MTGPTGEAAPTRLGLPFRHPAVLLATWFGVGFLPIAPGTWGSLAALPLAWLIAATWGKFALGAATLAVFASGCWAAGRVASTGGVKDPGCVVIDEVVGQWLVLAVAPTKIAAYGIGFLLFRIADIAKPWPASWADRAVPGGVGIMLDDIFAALYAAAAILLLLRFGLV